MILVDLKIKNNEKLDQQKGRDFMFKNNQFLKEADVHSKCHK